MVTMQVVSYFPNMTNKVKKKKCGPCISYEIFSGYFGGFSVYFTSLFDILAVLLIVSDKSRTLFR